MAAAIILAGGLGTRLAETVPHLPKTLAPIQGTAFLQLLFQQLNQCPHISKIVLALGHRAEAIEHFSKQGKTSIPIEFSIETSPLGTGGALLHALSKTPQETLLVLNGDSYFDLDLSQFFSFHKEKKADFSIACCYMQDTSRYGRIEIDAPTQRVLSFREKSNNAPSGWINAGLYLIKRSVLGSFSPGFSSLEKDFFPRLVQNQLFAYCHEGEFIDIGTPESYQKAQEILKPWIPL